MSEKLSHWDFMLEANGVLATWNLYALPTAWQELFSGEAMQRADRGTVPVEKIHDHRLHYLDYEGPLSENRGAVTRWDRGEFRVVEQDDSLWHVELFGERLQGNLTLEHGQESEWQLRTG